MRPTTTLCLIGLLSLSACSDLTSPALTRPQPHNAPEPAAAAPEKPGAKAQPAPDAPVAANDAEDSEMFEAAHILIAYKGAMRSDATRSKEEAQQLAQQLATQAKSGKNFGELAKQHSDDKGSAARGGSLGRFSGRQMVKPFADALKVLKPGEISAAVESPFGFHVILRSP